jgi:WD40 repeat protein
MGVVIGGLRFRTVGFLLVVVATTFAVSTSAAATVIRDVRGSPYRIGSDVLVFSLNGRWLAALETGGFGGRRRLWVMSVNTTTGGLERVRGAPYVVGTLASSAAFSPDGRLLVVGSSSGAIFVFSINSRTGALHQVGHWSDPMGPVDSVAFSARGGLLAAEDEGRKRAFDSGVSLLT